MYFETHCDTRRTHTKGFLKYVRGARSNKVFEPMLVDAVCTLESGAPNCRTNTVAIGSYVSSTPELPQMLCWENWIARSQSSLASSLWLDSALAEAETATATASSSTLTLNARCEGRGKLYKLVASRLTNAVSLPLPLPLPFLLARSTHSHHLSSRVQPRKPVKATARKLMVRALRQLSSTALFAGTFFFFGHSFSLQTL